MSEWPIIIEPLGKHHDRSHFFCGNRLLDRYIKEQANQDIRRRIASVFVAVADTRVVGFYCLSATAISRESLPDDMMRKLPKYPIPAVLLGRLAVDKYHQGKQIGKILLVNAMKRALLASQVIGMVALVVDAKAEHAKSFYQHIGFIEFEDHPLRLFLPLDTITDLL